MNSNEKIFSVLRAPRVSEKTARLQEHSNQYVFEISNEATKADVKAAVEQLFDVKVEAVNVLNVKGKNKSFRNRNGRRGDWRKAYVRLADGQSIDTLIGPQVTLHGDLLFSGGLYVEGRVHGRIVAEEGTKAVLIVAQQGRIEGEVQLPVVVQATVWVCGW